MAACGAGPPSTAQTALAAVLLLACGGLHLWLSAGAPPAGFYADDALYLLMAEWFAGGREPVLELVALRTHLPPLYSLLLAAVGASGDTPLPGHLVNAVVFTIALGLAALLHRARQPAWLALLGMLVVATAPLSLVHAVTLWSEPLYMVLSLGVLLALHRDRSDTRAWLAACALAGLALLTRSAGLALLVAMLWVALRTRPARPWLLLPVLLGPLLAWQLLGPERQPEEGYLDILLAVLTEHRPASLPDIVLANLQAMAEAWRRCFGLANVAVAPAAAAIAVLPVLAGWLLRLRRGRVDAVYVLAYLSMLLPWPATPDHFPRFMLPLLPLAVGYAADAGLLAAARLPAVHGSGRRLLAAAPLLLLAVCALPAQSLMVTRLLAPPPPALARFAHSTWWLGEPSREVAIAVLRQRASAVSAARELRQHLPEGQCLYAPQVQFHLLHVRRRVYLPPAEGTRIPPVCRYVFASAATDGTIMLEGISSGSTLRFAPQTVTPPYRPAGMLFELPQSGDDDARH